ncbi:hypothetical protein B9Z49_18530 [Limnohabitans sp. 2KL-51]|nr:hypothetical protein B9Z49_18530 [Limnohabitans sp. 2KL-51]
MQRKLLGRLGLLSFLLGLQLGVFDGLQFGRLFSGLAGHTVFFLLDARGPDRCDLTHPGAPRQILQLHLNGRFARNRLNLAVHAGREKAFTTGFDARHGAGMALRALRAPGFGSSQKSLALDKSPVNSGVLNAGLRIIEVKPLGPHPVQLERGTHAFGLGRRQLRLHAGPHGAGQSVAADHLEAGFALRGAAIDHLVIDATGLALPTHRDRLFIQRCDGHGRVKKRGLHHTLHIGLTGHADAQIAAGLAIDHPRSHWNGLGLSGLQYVLARPCPRRSAQPQQPSPANTCSHRTPVHRKKTFHRLYRSQSAQLDSAAHRRERAARARAQAR